jgi:hypothetical protein
MLIDHWIPVIDNTLGRKNWYNIIATGLNTKILLQKKHIAVRSKKSTGRARKNCFANLDIEGIEKKGNTTTLKVLLKKRRKMYMHHSLLKKRYKLHLLILPFATTTPKGY